MTSDPRAAALRSGYASIARAYAEHLGDELVGKPLDRAFLSAFVESVRGLIVDVGCGPGHVSAFLAEAGATVEGIDLSPAMIDIAREQHPGLAFREADMFTLPYADGSVGGLLAFYAIVHLQTAELGAVVAEIHRVLAPGGLAALAFHAGDETNHVDELFGCATSLDFVFHRPDAVIASLVDHGFRIEARLDRQPYPTVEYPSERTYLLARK